MKELILSSGRDEDPFKDLGVDGKTIGHMLKNRMLATPDALAYRSKKQGSWGSTTWQQAYEHASLIAHGLLAQGIFIGDRVAILSGTREEWTLCDQGILLCGGVTVPVYPSTPKEGCSYILNHSDAVLAFVEDEKQLAKLKEIQSHLPKLRKVVVFSQTFSGTDPFAVAMSSFLEQGRLHQKANPHLLDDIGEQLDEQSVATITYTSGTTGEPKGAILTHDAFTVGTRYALSATPTLFSDTQLFFLPLSHSFARMISIYAIRLGFCTAYAETIDKLVEDLAEIRPTCMLAVPRIFEKVYHGFLQKAQEGGRLKQSIVTWAIDIGRQVSKELQSGRKPKGSLALKYRLADRLVFKKLRDRLGGHIRWFISGSAPLSTEILEFFHGAGMIILEGYGLTETNSITSVNRMGHFKFGTVGKSHHLHLEIKIAPDGEILTRGITNFKGYFKLPSATKEAFDEEGWFKTGDIGEMDDEGFIRITDRKKELIKTSSGKFVAPQKLEGLLKLHPLVSQAVIVGERHQYITTLFFLQYETIQKWLQQKGGNTLSLGSLSPQEIASHPQLQAELSAHLKKVNEQLGSWEQIKYFRVVPHELTEAAGEITPSLKIKRKVINERYRDLIDSMYTEDLAQGHSHALL